MESKDEKNATKDVEQLAKGILLSYLDNDVVEILMNKFGSEDFLIQLRDFTKDKIHIRKKIEKRFWNVCETCSDLKRKLHLIKQKQEDCDFINKKYNIQSSLKYALQKRNMSQADLCKRTGIPKSTMSNIINDPQKANFLNITKIAYVLDESIHDIFYIEENHK